MTTAILILALILSIAPSAMAGPPPQFERIDLSGASGHEVRLLGLNDRGQVLGSDCALGASTCDLFLWTERGGKRIIGAGLCCDARLNNEGHVVYIRRSSYGHAVDLWTERTGSQTVPGMIWMYFLNDNDMIYGVVDSRYGLWTPKGGFTPIVAPQGGSFVPYSMNNDGMMVGGLWTYCMTCYEHPAVWSPSTGVVDLGGLPGLPRGQAGFVNDKGNISGTLLPADGWLNQHLFFWTAKDGMEYIGECPACNLPEAMNKHDQLAGRTFGSYMTPIRTYFWSRKTGLFDIGTLGGRVAVMGGMNDRGEIVGGSTDARNVWQPFFWSQDDGMVALTPGEEGAAGHINNDGLIVGSCKNEPCVWKRIRGR